MLEIQEQGSNTIIMNSTVLSTKLPLPKCGMLIRTIYKITISSKLFNTRSCPKWSVLFLDNHLIKTVFLGGRKERTILKHCRRRELFFLLKPVHLN